MMQMKGASHVRARKMPQVRVTHCLPNAPSGICPKCLLQAGMQAGRSAQTSTRGSAGGDDRSGVIALVCRTPPRSLLSFRIWKSASCWDREGWVPFIGRGKQDWIATWR